MVHFYGNFLTLDRFWEEIGEQTLEALCLSQAFANYFFDFYPFNAKLDNFKALLPIF
jgi:hypothetical protein